MHSALTFDDVRHRVDELRQRLNRLRVGLAELFVGKEEVIDLMVIAALAQEPLLIVGRPGTAKSDLVIKFCQALGFEIYQLLKEDPECPIDEIIEERFPGKDPTKWDFSSFVRSAPSAPAAKAGRKRKAPLTEASNKK